MLGVKKILQQAFDKNGAWAASGKVNNNLLGDVSASFFCQKTSQKYRSRRLSFRLAYEIFDYGYANVLAEDVQATLLALTAQSVADAVIQTDFKTGELWLCGGGAYNQALWQLLAKKLPHFSLHSTEEMGIAPSWIEASAFAWLAKQTLQGLSGNLPAVTGAAGKRILGGIFQA
jgi:anhydro-N-acetylmuramic acid kinase